MKSGTYIILSLFFLILAGVGVYYLVFVRPQTTYVSQVPPLEPTLAPTKNPQVIPTTPEPTISVKPTITTSPKISPTLVATKTPSLAPSPTPMSTIFTSAEDHFVVTYFSNRQVYQDKDANGGNRYTFYINGSNSSIAVHVGPTWSWTHPGRELTSDYTVSSQPTFRYLINSQTITDFQKDNLKYTVQCLHNGNAALKEECESFIQAIKFI